MKLIETIFTNFIDFSFLSYDLINFSSLFGYFSESNFAGKVILMILLIFSILAWSVIIGKLYQIRKLDSLNSLHQYELNNSGSIFNFNGANSSGPYAELTQSALSAYQRYSSSSKAKNKNQEIDLLMGHIENSLSRTLAKNTIKYEEKMVLLGSIVTGAPFLGLLGTVWGVMDAFGSISLGGVATLQSLAPGVTGALLTTVAALVVAIPSVFGYNYLLQKSKISIIDLENFSSTICDKIELESRSLPAK